MTHRLRSGEAAEAPAAVHKESQVRAVPGQPQQPAFCNPPRYPSPTPAPITSQAASSSTVQQPHSSSSQSQAEQSQHSFSPEVPSSYMRTSSADIPLQHASTACSADHVQLSLDVSEATSSVCAILSPVAGPAVDTDAEASGQQASDAAAAFPAAAALHDDDSEAVDNAEAQSHQSAESGVEVPEQPQTSGTQIDSTKLEELQKLLLEEKQKTAALIGKIDCAGPYDHKRARVVPKYHHPSELATSGGLLANINSLSHGCTRLLDCNLSLDIPCLLVKWLLNQGSLDF